MSNFLDFLEGVTLEEVTKSPRKSGGKKEWNPSGMGIRVFKDGRVFPSEELVNKFNLEYPERTANTDADSKKEYDFVGGPGNGFDLVDSRSWAQYKGDKHFLALAVVPKDQPKVDLFSTTRYDEETGKPVSSVLDQGSATFGKSTLIDALREVYGTQFGEKQDYIDLKVETGFNLKSLSANGIFLFPKKVSRGKDAGKDDYQRRENVDIFGLVPVAMEVKENITNVPSSNMTIESLSAGNMAEDEEADVQTEVSGN